MKSFKLNPKVQIPDAFDWRDRSLSLSKEVRDQGECGSCYAHACLQSLQTRLAFRYNKSVKLSVQEIIECSGDYGTYGCDGGSIIGVFSYIKARGISLEEDYPQTKEIRTCNENPKRLNISIEKMWISS